MKAPSTAFWSAFAAYAANVPTVAKTEVAEFVGKGGGRVRYSYATLSAVLGSLLPALLAVGLVPSQSTYVEAGQLMLRTALVHLGSGEGLESISHICGVEVTGQELGRLSTFAKRQAFALIGLVVPEDDVDAQEPQPPATKPPPRRPAAKDTRPPADRIIGAMAACHSVEMLARLMAQKRTTDELAKMDALDVARTENAAAARRRQLEAEATPGSQSATSTEPEKERKPLTPSQLLAVIAGDGAYVEFLKAKLGIIAETPEEILDAQHGIVGVVSRSEIDGDPVLVSIAKSHIAEYRDWMKG